MELPQKFGRVEIPAKDVVLGALVRPYNGKIALVKEKDKAYYITGRIDTIGNFLTAFYLRGENTQTTARIKQDDIEDLLVEES